MTIAQSSSCGNACYPYYFCPPATPKGPLQILCESCPQDVGHGLSVFAPGIPCLKIVNTFVAFGSKEYVEMYIDSTGQPTEVFDPTQVQNDVASAELAYAEVCPDLRPNTTCCETVELETDPTIFSSAGWNASSTPAFTTMFINPSTCNLVCTTFVMHLNFTNDFLTATQGGDPSQIPVVQSLVSSADWGNIPDDPPPGFTFFSLLNYVAHELGHALGYPEEDLVSPTCAVDGVMQYPSSGEAPINGLTNLEACWFKQLYCPGPCPTDAPPCNSELGVADKIINIDPFIFISLSPNPFDNTATLLYSLGTPAYVNVQVFDDLGRNIVQIPSKFMGSGQQSFIFESPGSGENTFYIRIEANGSAHTYRVIHTGH